MKAYLSPEMEIRRMCFDEVLSNGDDDVTTSPPEVPTEGHNDEVGGDL